MIGSVIGFFILGFGEGKCLPASFMYAGLPLFAVSNIYAGIKCFNIIDKIPLVEKEAFSDDLGDGISKLVNMILFLGVAVLFMIFFEHMVGALVGPFLEVYIMNQLNIKSIADLSLAYIPGGIISLLYAPKLGKLADNINAGVYLFMAGLIGASGTWILIQSTAIWHISLLFIIDATVITSSAQVLSRLVSNLAKNRKGSILGFQGFMSNMGKIAGPLIGGYFWEMSGSRGPFHFSIATEVILAIAYIIILYPILHKIGVEKIKSQNAD